MQHVGDEVHLRGLIELSNHCVRSCAYCGIAKEHTALTRYRMSAEEAVECAREAQRFGYGTVVMGASFRNTGEVLALVGCDRLTISPELLAALEQSEAGVVRALVDAGARRAPPARLDESAFRWQHNEDAMATDKLADGIRKFAVDQRKLETLLAAKLG